MRPLSLILALLLAVSRAGAQGAPAPAARSGRAAIVYADSASLLLTAPDGWVLDAEAGRRDGLTAVLYRVGEGWRTGRAVMYAHLSAADSGPALQGVNAAVARDAAEFRAHASDMRIDTRLAVRLVGGGAAPVRTYFSESLGNFDAVAYLPARGDAWLLVLTARSAADFDAAYADFVRLVRSASPGPMVGHQ